MTSLSDAVNHGDARVQRIRVRLLQWYRAHRRDLPWRRTRDPYAIWVSEIMLQQTRVDTVIPYFERFITRFPTPSALAKASEDEVLSMWSGLGYYRRARLLHAGMKEVVKQHAGVIPLDAEARRALPGIGRYTAGAIGSIAFQREEALVDGNVARVLSRLFDVDTPLGRSPTEKRLWALAETLVMGESPGDFNQSMMELGALVCTPKRPQCIRCPVREDCDAYRVGSVLQRPVPRVKKAPKEIDLVAVVPTLADRVWLHKSDEALFGGLFGFPMLEGQGRTVALKTLRDAGLRARLQKNVHAQLTHVLTHRRMRIQVWLAKATADAHLSEMRRFFQVLDLEEVGIATLTRKILKAAQGPAVRQASLDL